MRNLSNITLAELRAILALRGLTVERTKGGHEMWSKEGMPRPVVFQTPQAANSRIRCTECNQNPWHDEEGVYRPAGIALILLLYISTDALIINRN